MCKYVFDVRSRTKFRNVERARKQAYNSTITRRFPFGSRGTDRSVDKSRMSVTW